MESVSSFKLASSDIFFPDGFEGYPEWKHFKIEQKKDIMPVMILHSVEEPKMSFIIADPRIWFPNYQVRLSNEDFSVIKAAPESDLLAFSIITVDSEPFEATANLLGPLVINPQNRLGKQVVQDQSPYSARQSFSSQTTMLTFEEGLIGFPEWTKYVLNVTDEIRPVKLLVNYEQPRISFLVVSPALIDPEYKVVLTKEDLDFLGTQDYADLDWLAIVNVQNEPFDVTINMRGPIVYNLTNGKARQVILSETEYVINYKLENSEIKFEVGSAGTDTSG